MHPKVDTFLQNAKRWQGEMSALRSILNECGLIEDLKWGSPCYAFNKTNLFMIASFKEYCTLSFFNGVLLKDEKKLLVSPGENSQSVRLAKFTRINEIEALCSDLKAYIFEAIELEKLGIKVEKKKEQDPYPAELIDKMDGDQDFKSAFEKLTPGRQRGYLLFINGAKQSATRFKRIEKYAPRILKGQGIHDCICGHSKRKPTCDGSHKNYGITV